MITLWWTRSSGWVTWCIVDKNAILNKVMGLKGGGDRGWVGLTNMWGVGIYKRYLP